MKKYLLSFVSLFMVALFAAAQDSEPVEKLFADGKYYIQNVESGLYWGVGNDWGTRASLVKNPAYVTLIGNEDGTYKMETQVSNGGTAYYFEGDYMDNGNAKPLTIAEAGDYFTISSDAGYYGYNGTSVLGKGQAADAKTALWNIISEEEMQASLATATAEAPVDATFLILDPNFGRNNRNQGAWIVSEETTNKNLSGGNNTNNCAESFHSVFNISQTIENAPAGIYKLTAQGFYRQDGEDNENLPKFFANEETSDFPLKTGSENNMGAASESFSAGNYAADPIFFELPAGEALTIGAKLETNTNLWCIWDNFELTYYGTEADIATLLFGDLIAQVETLREQAGELQSNENISTYTMRLLQMALQGSFEIEQTEEAYKEAIAALDAAVKQANLEIASKPAIDGMYAELEATNVYTAEAYEAYKAMADGYKEAFDNGELTEMVVNPQALAGWHSANAIDDLLLSAWSIGENKCKDYDTALYINTWSVEGDNDGTNFHVPFFEYWTGDDNSLGANTLTATVEGVTPGKYDVTAWVRVRAKNGYEAPAYGITLDVNGGEAVDVAAGEQIGESQFYLAEFKATGDVAEDGILKINFNIAEDNNISWLSFKNVKYAESQIPVIAETYEGYIKQTLSHPAMGVVGSEVSAQTVTVSYQEGDLTAEGGSVDVTFSGFTLPGMGSVIPEFTVEDVAVTVAEDGSLAYAAEGFVVGVPMGQMTVNYNGTLAGKFAADADMPEFTLMIQNATTDSVVFKAGFMEISDIELASDGIFDEEGDVKVAVTYVPTVAGYDEIVPDVVFHYTVKNGEEVVAEGEKNPTDISDGALNIYVSDLDYATEYTVTIDKVTVQTYGFDEETFDFFTTVLFEEEGELATVTFTTETEPEPEPEITFTDLTPAMYHVWDGVDATATIAAEDKPYCIYEIGTPAGNIYGNSSVPASQYADLSDFAILKIVATEGTPRLLLNRPTDDSQDYINLPSNTEQAEKYIISNEDGVFIYDLGAIFDDYGFVHLNAIKGANWQNVTITSIEVGPVPTEIEFDIDVERYTAQGYDAQTETIDFAAAKEFLGVEEITYDMLRIVNPDGTEISDYAPYDGWFNAEGVAETWGSNTKICVKFFQTIENGTYEICDMNGADEAGATYDVTWALVANDKKVFYNISVTFVKAPTVELTISDLAVKTSVDYVTDEADYVEKTATLSDEDITAILAELGLESLDNATVYGYNPTTAEFIKNYAGFDGWRAANGDFHAWDGDGSVAPACVKYTDGQTYLCYNRSGQEAQTIKTYWAIANDTKAVLVEISFTYTPATAITSLSTADAEIEAVYTIGGAQLQGLQKGMNIVKYANGSIKKVFVK